VGKSLEEIKRVLCYAGAEYLIKRRYSVNWPINATYCMKF